MYDFFLAWMNKNHLQAFINITWLSAVEMIIITDNSTIKITSYLWNFRFQTLFIQSIVRQIEMTMNAISFTGYQADGNNILKNWLIGSSGK